MKNRFFVDASFAAGSDVELRGEEFHHAARVVRLLAGEKVDKSITTDTLSVPFTIAR